MIKTSFKQLLRTPWKVLLFFLLMAACALLLVFSSCLFSETAQRIDEVENSFTTIGTIETPVIGKRTGAELERDPVFQTSISAFEDIYPEEPPLSEFDFEGAKYVLPPENLPYYAAYLPEIKQTHKIYSYSRDHVMELTPQEDYVPDGRTEVMIGKVLHTWRDDNRNSSATFDYPGLIYGAAEGKTLWFYQWRIYPELTAVTSLEQGKRYIASVGHGRYSYRKDGEDFQVNLTGRAPFSTQHNRDGSIRRGLLPYNEEKGIYLNRYISEVTDGFYNTPEGKSWLNWVENLKMYHNLFLVQPARSMITMPAFQSGAAFITEGREITREEFESGAKVCMVPSGLANANGLKPGDKITLPLLCSLYDGAVVKDVNNAEGVMYQFSLLDANGDIYKPFWETEYEIAGIYNTSGGEAYSQNQLAYDMFIIPYASVMASDEDNIAGVGHYTAASTVFQIPNGTIAEFDAALREHVPEMDSLTVTYNDNGYTDIMASLKSTRTTAVLLFAVGAAAGIAVVVLLLYFFVVRQKKRTAIEQSLGMTKGQCRASLLAGVMVLTLLACIVGGTLGGVLISRADTAAPGQLTNIYSEAEEADEAKTEGITMFNTKYSLWASGETQNEAAEEAAAPAWLMFASPAALCLLVLILAAVLVNRNLKIDPILLLGGKEE